MSTGYGSAPSNGHYSMEFSFSRASGLSLYTQNSIATLWAKYQLNSFSPVRKLRLREAKNLKQVIQQPSGRDGIWVCTLSFMPLKIGQNDRLWSCKWKPSLTQLGLLMLRVYIKWHIMAEAESQQEEQSLCPLTPDSRISGILPSSFPTVQEKPSSSYTWVSQSNQCSEPHHNIVGKTSAQSPHPNRPKKCLLSPWLFAKKGELRVKSSCLYRSQLHNSYSQWQSTWISKVKTITKHPLLEIIAIA